MNKVNIDSHKTSKFCLLKNLAKRHDKIIICSLVILIVTSIVITSASVSYGKKNSVAKRLKSEGFIIEVYDTQDNRVETKEQLDGLRGNYVVKLVSKETTNKRIELTYRANGIESIACIDSFDECSGSYYVIRGALDAEYYLVYYMQDYDTPIKYYSEIIKGSKVDIRHYFNPEGKLSKEDGKAYLNDLKSFITKYKLDKKSLKTLAKETNYFRNSLTSKREIVKAEQKEVKRYRKVAIDYLKNKYDIIPTSIRRIKRDKVETTNTKVFEVTYGNEQFNVIVDLDTEGAIKCGDTRQSYEIENATKRYIADRLGVQQYNIYFKTSEDDFYTAKYRNGMDISAFYREELGVGVRAERVHSVDVCVLLPDSISNLKSRYLCAATSTGDELLRVKNFDIYTVTGDLNTAYSTQADDQKAVEYLKIAYSRGDKYETRSVLYGIKGELVWSNETKINNRE